MITPTLCGALASYLITKLYSYVIGSKLIVTTQILHQLLVNFTSKTNVFFFTVIYLFKTFKVIIKYEGQNFYYY